MSGHAETDKGAAIRHTQEVSWFLALVLSCLSLSSSTLPKQTTPQKLHVTTHLVVVNVVVHSRKGEPVEGLTQRDFTILDDRKPQPIKVFSVESRQIAPKVALPLPANVFSNRVARQGDVPVNIAVILLDGAHMSFGDSVFARDEVVKLVRQIPPGERIALYVLGQSGLSVIQDFTSDPSPLMEALRGFHGYVGDGSAALGPRASLGTPTVNSRDAAAHILADMNDRPKPGQIEFRGRTTSDLGAARIIADRLSGLPGRKSLIWVTDHLFYPGPEFFSNPSAVLGYEGNIARQAQLLRRVIRTLNQADVAVYPVDAHGLVVGPIKTGSVHSADLAPLWPGEVWTLDMDYWAKHTGGRAFYYTNGLHQAIGKALNDSKVTYTLGYYPSDVAWNGKYHHIKVLVDRKDVQIRYRCGYYAGTFTADQHTSPATLLEAAAGGPLESAGLGVTVRLIPIGNPTLHKFKTAVYVDGRGLTYQPEKGRYDVSFMVWVGQYTKQGRLLEKKAKKLSFKLSEANYHSALAGGLGVTLREAVKPQAWRLGVAVLDTASGTTGSVRIPLH